MNNLFDIVIPVGPKDQNIIRKQINFTQKNIIGYRNIYLVCNDSNFKISGCITIDEQLFPFNKDTIKKYGIYTRRCGWYLQQLVKLYAGFTIPNILDRYLVLDCDTFFLKPTKFIEDDKCLYDYRNNIYQPYITHLQKLGLKHMNLDKSWICDHMILETQYIKKLLQQVESDNLLFYQIFLQLIDEKEKKKKKGGGASEFEIYMNFMLQYYPDKIKIRKLNHLGVVDIKDIKGNLDYVSYHWYMRK